MPASILNKRSFRSLERWYYAIICIVQTKRERASRALFSAQRQVDEITTFILSFFLSLFLSIYLWQCEKAVRSNGIQRWSQRDVYDQNLGHVVSCAVISATQSAFNHLPRTVSVWPQIVPTFASANFCVCHAIYAGICAALNLWVHFLQIQTTIFPRLSVAMPWQFGFDWFFWSISLLYSKKWVPFRSSYAEIR